MHPQTQSDGTRSRHATHVGSGPHPSSAMMKIAAQRKVDAKERVSLKPFVEKVPSSGFSRSTLVWRHAATTVPEIYVPSAMIRTDNGLGITPTSHDVI